MKLNLSVEIDSGAGFCFGVERAIEIAESILAEGKELYCLGQIVHNQEEVKRLESLGMISTDHNQLSGLMNKNVLIRSHGEAPSTYRLLKKNHNTIIEATCPIVLKLQKRIQESHDHHHFVLIFGKKDHPEVIGLIGHLHTDYKVFEKIEDLELDQIPDQLTLYSQTTMDLAAFYQAKNYLEENGKDVEFKDTVCRKVSGKKETLVAFAKSKDIVIMVAGKNSSNGKVLFGICQDANHNSYSVVRADELNPDWFHQNESVGITGATSTPRWQMEEIASFLKSL